mgnify:CR=1 FL=1
MKKVLFGTALGVVAGALGYKIYKENEIEVNDFLREKLHIERDFDDFDDEDFDKIRAIYPKRPGKTSSILYKQSGNSIVVNVLEAILNEIYRR